MSALATSNNGLYKTRTLFSVELHPSTVANVLGGVKEQLNAHLLRYVDEFDGVLLSYSKLEIRTKKPIIHPYFPYFHLDVSADVLVFKPVRGMTLVGRVNHLGEDYISALVLGVFNATIPARSVSEELQFLWEEAKWVGTKQPQHQIAEHSYIIFKVEEVRDFGGFFQVTGSMRDPGTGAADFLFPGVQLPEPPTLDLGAVGEDALEPPSGGEGKRGEAEAAAMTQETDAKHATQGKKDGTRGKDDNKRKRNSETSEQPKGKRRRKQGDQGVDKGVTPGVGAMTATPAATATTGVPSAVAMQAVKAEASGAAKEMPAAANVTPAAAAAPALVNGVAGASTGKHKSKSDKKKDKGRGDKEKGDKGKEDKGGGADVGAGHAVAPAAATAAPETGGVKSDKKTRDKDKERSEKKKDKKDKLSDGGHMAAVTPAVKPTVAAAAPPAAAQGPQANGGVAATANGGAAGGGAAAAQAAADGGGGNGKKHKDKSSKDGKESTKKHAKKDKGKESTKKEGKESSKKEGKESSKKEGKESSKKDKGKVRAEG